MCQVQHSGQHQGTGCRAPARGPPCRYCGTRRMQDHRPHSDPEGNCEQRKRGPEGRERGQAREQAHEQIRLGQSNEGVPHRGPWLTCGLERSAAEYAVIDPRPPSENPTPCPAVDVAPPRHMARLVVLARPLALEKCLCSPIVALLTP